jgi:cytochrome P450
MGLCQFLLTAGTVTVTDFLGNSIYYLLQHPEWMSAARRHPEHVPALLEELFRLEPPVLTSLRQTRTPVVIGGVAIPADGTLFLAVGAANRDPAKYDAPDEIILNRAGPKSLSFSVGPHYCLGAPLGRLACEVILTELLTELPTLRSLQPLETVEFEGSPYLRDIKVLRLGFEHA